MLQDPFFPHCEADGPPVMSHTAFGDAVGGLNGCAAVLTALIHAGLTGKGQFIDLAQIECMIPFAAPWIVAHSIDGKEPLKSLTRLNDYYNTYSFAVPPNLPLLLTTGLRYSGVLSLPRIPAPFASRLIFGPLASNSRRIRRT